MVRAPAQILPLFISFAFVFCAHAGGEASQTDTAPSSQISVTERVVFDGDAGWEHDGVVYRLACGACVREAPNGDLLCWWLSGSGTEPATDNNVLMARSTDKGKTWSAPEVFIAAGDMAGACTAMWATSDGRLIAFAAQWPSEKEYTQWFYSRLISKDNGHTWSAPEPFVVHDTHAAIGGPIRLADGDYLFAGSFFDQRPKPLTGSVSTLLDTTTESEALAVPPAEGNPGIGPKFLAYLHGTSVYVTSNVDGTGLSEYGHIANRPLGLLEPTCVQLHDGRIVMLMRAENAGYLWRAESSDNGRTWTDAWETDIPNPTSSIQLLRLDDSRIVLLHNACGERGKMIQRDPLSIWISDDELASWSIKADVLHGGWLAYPNGIVLDGRLVFVYDRNRRQVRFVEATIPVGRGSPASKRLRDRTEIIR